LRHKRLDSEPGWLGLLLRRRLSEPTAKARWLRHHLRHRCALRFQWWGEERIHTEPLRLLRLLAKPKARWLRLHWHLSKLLLRSWGVGEWALHRLWAVHDAGRLRNKLVGEALLRWHSRHHGHHGHLLGLLSLGLHLHGCVLLLKTSLGDVVEALAWRRHLGRVSGHLWLQRRWRKRTRLSRLRRGEGPGRGWWHQTGLSLSILGCHGSLTGKSLRKLPDLLAIDSGRLHTGKELRCNTGRLRHLRGSGRCRGWGGSGSQVEGGERCWLRLDLFWLQGLGEQRELLHRTRECRWFRCYGSWCGSRRGGWS
jgi:hypothetical protein